MARKRRIPASLRNQVIERAEHRCGYCLVPEVLMGAPMTVDHIVPESVGGLPELANLWTACHRFNTFKAAKERARDPETGRFVRLFNPPRLRWWTHFAWSADGTLMTGCTACGRATIAALHLNNEHIVATRRQWVAAGG